MNIHANTTEPELVEIIERTVQWHTDCVRKLKALVAIDDDTEIEVNCADGTRISLTGDQRGGFKVGAHAALMIFENFPLKINPIEQEPEWQRDDEATYCTLLLIGGHNVSPDAIASWSDEQCQQAEQWAMAIHLQASDNVDVEVPRTPDCVRPFLVRS